MKKPYLREPEKEFNIFGILYKIDTSYKQYYPYKGENQWVLYRKYMPSLSMKRLPYQKLFIVHKLALAHAKGVTLDRASQSELRLTNWLNIW